MADLVVPPGRGVPRGLVIGDEELQERFSRSSGPGGQGVNTTDSRVELSWDIDRSAALTDEQRARLQDRLAHRLVDGVITLAAAEQRSQLQNRNAARARLAMLIAESLEPPPPPRRATRPSRAARDRRIEAKKHRGSIKSNRKRPPLD